MAEFDSVFDGFGDTMSEGVENMKDLLKEKPFVVAAVVVAAVALFVAWKRSRETVETTNETATFYTYPTAGGGATFQGESYADSMYYDLLKEIQQQDKDYQDALSDLESDYSAALDKLDKSYTDQISELEKLITSKDSEMSSNVSSLNKENAALKDQIAMNQMELQKQSIMNQMEANSDLWHLTSDPAEKERLKAENQALGASIGLSCNSGAGTWHNPDGTRAYETPLQTVQGRTTSNTKTSGTMTNNATYNKEYSDAAAKAASGKK